MYTRFIPAALMAAMFSLLNGCATTAEDNHTAELNNDDYYEVNHEGRLYIFDDAATYLSFIDVGETAYRKVRIGDGPNGETVVFGLTAEDKKKSEGIAGIDMFDGRLAGAESFYGEVVVDGRIYVFNDWGELKVFKQTGEATYRYTDIGAGPHGETVVYVLPKAESKQRPVATITRFRQLHSI